MVEIKEIREALTLYFIRQLAEDEAQRASRVPRKRQDYPEWDSIDKWESDPDNQIGDYHQHLYDELKFNFTNHAVIVLKAMEEFGEVKIDMSSEQFNWVYREFIKTEIEVIKVIEERIKCDYSVEMRYLWGDDTGLSSSAVALCDVSQPRSSLFQDYIRKSELEQKQQKHSQQGASIRKRETDEQYAVFDPCVFRAISQYPDKNDTWIARHCKKETGIVRSDQTLRKRVADLKLRW